MLLTELSPQLIVRHRFAVGASIIDTSSVAEHDAVTIVEVTLKDGAPAYRLRAGDAGVTFLATVEHIDFVGELA